MKQKNKFNIFSIFSKKNKDDIVVNDNNNEVEEELELDTDYTEGSMDELVNEEQKKQLATKEASDNLDLLKSLSLHELEMLEKELEFKYDFSDYTVLNVNRTDKFIVVQCQLTTMHNEKQNVIEKIECKQVKDDWDF